MHLRCKRFYDTNTIQLLVLSLPCTEPCVCCASLYLLTVQVRRASFCLWLLATVVSGQVDITDAEEGLGLAGALLRSQTPSPGNSQSSSSDMPTWQELHKIWLNSRRLSPLLLNETSFQLKSFPTGVAAGEDSEVLLQSTFNPIPAAQLRTSNIRCLTVFLSYGLIIYRAARSKALA